MRVRTSIGSLLVVACDVLIFQKKYMQKILYFSLYPRPTQSKQLEVNLQNGHDNFVSDYSREIPY